MQGVLLALDHIPGHRHPRIQLDSQSPWVTVDSTPGVEMSVWLQTGDVFEQLEDGSVGLDPLAPVEKEVDST